MTTNRRLLTPVTASVLAGLVVAFATVGGSLSGDRAAVKGDRFAAADAALCAGEQWPNLSNACLAWADGAAVDGPVRFVTVATTDHDAGVTTLARVPAAAAEAF